jgi:hypothetical protein
MFFALNGATKKKTTQKIPCRLPFCYGTMLQQPKTMMMCKQHIVVVILFFILNGVVAKRKKKKRTMTQEISCCCPFVAKLCYDKTKNDNNA